VRGLTLPGRTGKPLSRRAMQELGALQANEHALRAPRNAALRLFLASRHAATPRAQREFWLEFSWHDQEYRAAVRRLSEFCLQQRARLARAPTP
jgi:hypothetical protein